MTGIMVQRLPLGLSLGSHQTPKHVIDTMFTKDPRFNSSPFATLLSQYLIDTCILLPNISQIKLCSQFV